jgi:DNA processing protein
VQGIGQTKANVIRRGIDQVLGDGVVQREKQEVEQCGAVIVAMEDEGYPQLLKHIPDPPPMLYVRGEIRKTDALSLAVVGARRCTQYGRDQADRLSALCAEAGLCIVSGGAYGIDATAHRAAMRVKGRTMAVLGSGLARPYPEVHAELFDAIVDGQGAVVSELPMTTPPAAENFPRRNRIISGMALGVLVVEAATRSGALITARLAVEDHGREVMAVPGRVDSMASAGCHKAIREGWATLVTSAADVLDALGDAGQILKAGVTQSKDDGHEALFEVPGVEQNMSDGQRKIMEALTEPLGLDELSNATGLAVHELQSDLTMLELRGSVKREAGRFVRKR